MTEERAQPEPSAGIAGTMTTDRWSSSPASSSFTRSALVNATIKRVVVVVPYNISVLQISNFVVPSGVLTRPQPLLPTAVAAAPQPPPPPPFPSASSPPPPPPFLRERDKGERGRKKGEGG
ncbi:Os06g0141800 [Oryza sativa Japonica Group]|uniref:Os06g0141800 protein n=2 Tax=Oryza sativa subsp. japonica TaxID=39947 RepID=Q0DEP6_ORYSJ|nr:hypothetical protein EE612_031851 [Oryza sativa]KAF2925113.1 hypothetical protein DAI22_06g028650 [Oryza sativa Japonica Group]BAF18677.1 Os06g0141800 [Oryza sativa Japonica Group]BAS96090.1 Os06g0141800 [Oryza sativa Japonica Group]|eukprot:NP_001056763.1 Os06g0141800 [Oryza sativa Japonica Group]